MSKLIAFREISEIASKKTKKDWKWPFLIRYPFDYRTTKTNQRESEPMHNSQRLSTPRQPLELTVYISGSHIWGVSNALATPPRAVSHYFKFFFKFFFFSRGQSIAAYLDRYRGIFRGRSRWRSNHI